MRGEARVREALGFVTLLWNHPFLTGMLILIFTPPFFPLVVYFSPLLMSTALCVVALVSVGSQMEKIKAEGGPGQFENHLRRDQGISTWMPRDGLRIESLGHHYGHRDNRHRNHYANINVVPVTPSWTEGSVGGATTTRVSVPLRPEPVENNPPTPAAVESDEDWLDKWVMEYESRPGWGEQEDQTLPTPVIQTSTRSLAPATSVIPTSISGRDESNEYVSSVSPVKRTRSEIHEEKCPIASVPAPAVARDAGAASALVAHRENLTRSFPPMPPTPTSGNQEEVVVVLKESVLQPYISFAPICTGREKQVNRICQPTQEMHTVPTNSVVVERVSDVQALQSIDKLLYAEMGGSTPPISLPRNAGSSADVKSSRLENSSGTKPQVILYEEAMSPQLNAKASVSASKGHAVEASEKNRNKIAIGASPDIAGETPLLRHLKTSRTEKQSRTSSGYSPLVLRTSRGLMSEKVLPPPQFSPRLLQSLQPLPPKGFSPRLPNSSMVPLSNPVEKIPQWVYDGIPKETTETQVKQAETAKEKHVTASEQAVKVLSYPRRRTHARRPSPIQVNYDDLQPRSFNVSTANKSNINLAKSVAPDTILKETTSEQAPEVSPHMPVARADLACGAATIRKPVDADPPPNRILENFATERMHGNDVPHGSTKVASIEKAALPISTTPAAFSPRTTPLAVAASSDVDGAAVSPRQASVAASPRTCSPTASSSRETTMAASPRQASIAASPTPASVASSPRRPSVPSSPSIPYSRRRRHGFMYASDKLALTSPSLLDEVSYYYDAPPAAAADKEEKVVAELAAESSEEYVPIEKEVSSLPKVEVNDLPDLKIEEYSISAPYPVDGALHWGRSLSARRSSPSRKSRRRLEPRRVVMSQDTDRFSLKKSLSLKILDSTSDDERESVTPRASRRLGRTIKPLVWRSRSMTNREDSD
uniref:Uncharacterized protein n=1 Tax=Physcomitrium patens TaxID=3218 RepID=A9T366_PHYPA|nr:flocculation protein FLO11-like [Physcomitrium patens]PNR42537.1 hypothetical protein PHYPA_017367 [Physcomitrium patens]|eukprot:XP_024392366.1 flocculation protein FLO11-like [Physcomitrella patens]